ncbi:hypothetical protein J2S19_002839 [Metabacillus malikii]|uniref:Uncharacterized protein n=1 Tax=Metabacillus malikii TaxID=1504265 RepID=A0ABT9ZH02_9BACI|nr:hypothetical protein [Metabacillus malikii]
MIFESPFVMQNLVSNRIVQMSLLGRLNSRDFSFKKIFTLLEIEVIITIIKKEVDENENYTANNYQSFIIHIFILSTAKGSFIVRVY